MLLVAKVKLLVTRDESLALLAIMEKYNAACNWLAEQAMTLKPWERKKRTMQRVFYAQMIGQFGLPAQATIRAIDKVHASFERDLHTQPTFKEHGAIRYDYKMLTFQGPPGMPESVSIQTLDGRIKGVPIVAGGPHAEYLARRGDHPADQPDPVLGESQLVLRKGRWYLHTSLEIDPATMHHPDEYLGVDLGVVNIAVDSDGNFYSNDLIETLRVRIKTLTDALQACGSRSAKRHLKKLAGKVHRARTDINHVISKRLVQLAKDTGRGISLEDLLGIRDRITFRKGQRARMGSWAFSQLRLFITYKGERVGVRVVVVDPRNTSRTCTVETCGHIDKKSRRSQSEFICRKCGFADHADHVGAVNIAKRGAVGRPIVSSDDAGNAAPPSGAASSQPSLDASSVL